jgi:hypothetical protein
LVLVLALFCLIDVYYLANIAEHGKLQNVKPGRIIREQLDKVLQDTAESPVKPANEAEYERYDPVKVAKWKMQLIEEARIDQKEKEEISQGAETYESISDEDLDYDKDQIYEILEQAGIHKSELNKATRAQLPTWTKVLREYGDHPLIYGLERCENFTSSRDMSMSFFGIAGTFNSGTNLLAELLIQNCQITERMEKYGEDQRGIRWQVPWGKHTPVQFRGKHVTRTDRAVPLENSFPMITIRDPYSWLLSMCRHPYAARWGHEVDHCPNIVSYRNNEISNVYVFFQESLVEYDNLPEMWNKWYQDYLAVDFPRVLVRFEDLLFFGKNVTETLCACGGGVPRRPNFVHIQDSAKLGTAAHGNHKTGLVQALIRYGNFQNRTIGMTAGDVKYAKEFFDDELMKMFNYRHP